MPGNGVLLVRAVLMAAPCLGLECFLGKSLPEPIRKVILPGGAGRGGWDEVRGREPGLGAGAAGRSLGGARLAGVAQLVVSVAGDDGAPAEALLTVTGEGQVGVGRQKGAAVGSVRHAGNGSLGSRVARRSG
ncbi:hypothetical protein GCM10010236_73190 [Streptomyces eurythermus]|nr:hypothetical protein GCM10010236_73190 [Streptomyces eurythermus]